jgi:hypothetical protein
VVVAYVLYVGSNTKWFKRKFKGWKERMKAFRRFFPKTIRYTLVFLIVYSLLIISLKEVALYERSDWSKVESDQAIPNGFYEYVYCVDNNDTAYKVVNMAMLTGNDEYLYLNKSEVHLSDNLTWANFSFNKDQAESRVKHLVDNEGSQVITYFVYRINLTKDGAKVQVYDARRELVGSTIPQSEGYVFVFKDGLDKFKAYPDSAYAGENSVLSGEIPSYKFE